MGENVHEGEIVPFKNLTLNPSPEREGLFFQNKKLQSNINPLLKQERGFILRKKTNPLLFQEKGAGG
jgi:hypothetical protein